jgi:hypothetical protein
MDDAGLLGGWLRTSVPAGSLFGSAQEPKFCLIPSAVVGMSSHSFLEDLVMSLNFQFGVMMFVSCFIDPTKLQIARTSRRGIILKGELRRRIEATRITIDRLVGLISEI